MKLNSLLLPILSAALVVSAQAGTSAKAPAQCQIAPEEATLGVTATLAYDTDYVFRGVLFAQNLVSGNIDVVVPIDKTFSLDLNAWYGASVDDSAATFAGGGSYGELDLSATLLAKIGSNLTAGLKYTWYDYVGNAGKSVKDINEIGVTLATTLKTIDLSAGGYYDFTARGYYYEFGVSHSFKITEHISLVPGALISFADHYYGVNGGNHVKVSLAAPIKLTKTATLTPYIAGNLPYDSLKSAGEKERVYGGVALSVTF